MSYLTLSRGKKIVMGVSFEPADDSAVAATAAPEIQEALIDEMRATGSNDMDKAAGLTTTAMATLTVVNKSIAAEDTQLFMTADELRLHIAQATAVLKTMTDCGRLVDRHMATYRANIRRRVREAEAADDASF